MPFLFGVPSTFFIVNKMEVPEDVVFVNIDSGKVILPYVVFSYLTKRPLGKSYLIN